MTIAINVARLEGDIADLEYALDLFDRRNRLAAQLAAIASDRSIIGRAAMDAIASEIAAAHDITLADIKGASPARRYAWPRQEAYWTLYQQRRPDGRRRWSTPQIGRWCGGRDHSTVIDGKAAHAKRMSEEREI